MKIRHLLLLLALLALPSAVLAQEVQPDNRPVPFSQLGVNLPLTLTLPADYVRVEKFKGVVVFCAKDDESQLKDNGDFNGAKRAVVSIRPSPSDYYDEKRRVFSFESPEATQSIAAAGAKNYQLTKQEVRGVPVASITFEIGSRKIYSLAVASGSVLIRLSYNARSESREIDDHVWATLVAGL